MPEMVDIDFLSVLVGESGAQIDDEQVDAALEVWLGLWADAQEALEEYGPSPGILFDAVGSFVAMERFDKDRLQDALARQELTAPWNRFSWAHLTSDQTDRLARWFEPDVWLRDFARFRRLADSDEAERPFESAMELYLALDLGLCLAAALGREGHDLAKRALLVRLEPAVDAFMEHSEEFMEASGFFLAAALALADRAPADLTMSLLLLEVAVRESLEVVRVTEPIRPLLLSERERLRLDNHFAWSRARDIQLEDLVPESALGELAEESGAGGAAGLLARLGSRWVSSGLSGILGAGLAAGAGAANLREAMEKQEALAAFAHALATGVRQVAAHAAVSKTPKSVHLRLIGRSGWTGFVRIPDLTEGRDEPVVKLVVEGLSSKPIRVTFGGVDCPKSTWEWDRKEGLACSVDIEALRKGHDPKAPLLLVEVTKGVQEKGKVPTR